MKENKQNRSERQNRILTADGEAVRGPIPEVDLNKSSHREVAKNEPVMMTKVDKTLKWISKDNDIDTVVDDDQVLILSGINKDQKTLDRHPAEVVGLCEQINPDIWVPDVYGCYGSLANAPDLQEAIRSRIDAFCYRADWYCRQFEKLDGIDTKTLVTQKGWLREHFEREIDQLSHYPAGYVFYVNQYIGADLGYSPKLIVSHINEFARVVDAPVLIKGWRVPDEGYSVSENVDGQIWQRHWSELVDEASDPQTAYMNSVKTVADLNPPTLDEWRDAE